MKCLKPFVSGKAAFGCGQCMPCRVNRRRTWAHRIMLEATDHADKSFVTLTYAGDPRELMPEHVTLWLKRLRKRVGKVRYFLVGEYGDTTWRPHYHAALFGVGPCMLPLKRKDGDCPCANCSAVRETWGYGHVTVYPLELKSAQYIAGYVTKKMTHREDPRLLGRYPEFARMSLFPGIGANALWDVASVMLQYGLEARPIPTGLGSGDKVLPIGRYMRKQLAKKVGLSDEAIASQADQALSVLYEQMSLVYEYAKKNGLSARQVFTEMNAPIAQKLEGRYKLKGRKL